MEVFVKVTRINDKWHIRLMKGDVIISEASSDTQSGIGYVCRDLLRWHDKMDGTSKFAKAARERQNDGERPSYSAKMSEKGVQEFKFK